MNKDFTIYVDRLQDGHTLTIEENRSSDFLDIHEEELSFQESVFIQGKAYLADDHLVIQLEIRTQFTMPCAICNESTAIPLEVKNFYHVEPIAEITTHLFDYTELLREAILIQIPPFVECHNGQCPARKLLSPYLKKENKIPVDSRKDPVHYPFADL